MKPTMPFILAFRFCFADGSERKRLVCFPVYINVFLVLKYFSAASSERNEHR